MKIGGKYYYDMSIYFCLLDKRFCDSLFASQQVKFQNKKCHKTTWVCNMTHVLHICGIA